MRLQSRAGIQGHHQRPCGCVPSQNEPLTDHVPPPLLPPASGRYASLHCRNLKPRVPPPPPPALPPLAGKCQPHSPDWRGVQRHCVAGRVPAGREGVGSVLRTAGAVGAAGGAAQEGWVGGLLKSCGAPSPLGCTPTAEGLSLTPPLAAEWTPQGCDPWRSLPSCCNTPSSYRSPALRGGERRLSLRCWP